MATFMARSAALVGVIAVSVLCEALVCEPAQASCAPPPSGSQVAFSCTLGLEATLDLYNGGTLVATVSTSTPQGLFQGFISNTDSSVVPTVGGPTGNTSYAAGSYAGMLLVDYFGFNMAALPATVTSVTSATLVLYSGKISNNVTYTLFGATQWVSELATPGDQNAALYANLVKGVTTDSYNSVQVAENTGNPLTQLMFALNGGAVGEINTAIKSKAVFAVAGQVSAAVPEPSTWVMLLAGFAGLGLVARRRAKRRAATAAG